MIDVLSDLLQTIRLSANSYFCSQFCSPWGMDVPTTGEGIFHSVLKGQAWLKLPNSEEVINMQAGDIIVFPKGLAHQISDQLQSKTVFGPQVIAQVQAGESPFTDGIFATTLLCGKFTFDLRPDHPLLHEIPQFIHISTQLDKQHQWLWQLVSQIGCESSSIHPGATVIADRLTEVLILQLFRLMLSDDAYDHRFLKALKEPAIGKALQLMHQNPAYNWTIEELADQVALSRTNFNTRFKQSVGSPPLTYLTEWRMLLARRKLEETHLSMQQIAEQSGYHSESAFNKVFNKFFAIGPGKLRRLKQQKESEKLS